MLPEEDNYQFISQPSTAQAKDSCDSDNEKISTNAEMRKTLDIL